MRILLQSHNSPRQFLLLPFLAIATMLLTPRCAAPPGSPAGDPVAGERTFKSFCVVCHGIDAIGGKGPSLTRGVFRHAEDDEELLNIIRFGISGTEMPGAFLGDHEVRNILAYIHALSRTRADRTLPGDMANGATLYQDAECAKCHVIRGQGGRMGPQLTDIGARRSADFLRAAVTAPQRDVPLNWRTVHITTGNGHVLIGRIMSEDGFSLRLMDQNENLHALLKEEIQSIVRDTVSAMPDYSDALNESQFDDLVAYLRSLTG